jgi:endonuclease/exonuclease/phosphatase family metal-dependent hydrolase
MTTELRVLSYNVLSLRLSVDAVIDVIKACRPDIVCLQEAPRFLFWRARLERVAAATGLTVAAGHRRAGAVAVLVARHVTVLEAGELRLPWRFGRHRRGVATALLDVGGQRLSVASVHMSLFESERMKHLPAIVSAAERHGVPVIIAGDLNEQDDGDVWRQLASRYQDAYAVAPDGLGDTFSARQPRRRIDAVFVDRSLPVLGCGVPDLPRYAEASDHRPLLARVAL